MVSFIQLEKFICNMKLYTEEQLRQMFYEGSKYAASIHPASIGEHYKYVENTINTLTPIELPSYEEIELVAEEKFTYGGSKMAFEIGAKWVIEQIKQQGNG